jgi:dihydroorotate dehydrogenase (NAD+) catalytic subunit
MLHTPFYNPQKSYEENYEQGPFGAFADLSSEVPAKGGGKIFSEEDRPKCNFLGVKIHSLFGIPAGPLVNGRFVKAALNKGFDLPVYKTVRSGEYPCHQWPNVLAVKVEGDITKEKAGKGLLAGDDYREPLSITNSFGVPSRDPDFWQKDLAGAVKYAKDGQAVIGSFQGTATGGDEKKYIGDFVLTAKLVKETGCKILEVNLSCPNEGTAHLLCFDVERVKKITEAIKNEIGNTPLIIKIAYFAAGGQLSELVQAAGKTVDGIAAINTIPAKIYNKEGQQALPGQNRLVSGTCGAGIKWAGLEMVKRLKSLRNQNDMKFTIVGVGGVMSPADYAEYKAAGADAVMSATGAMWNPFLAQEIKQTIND